MNDSVTVSVFGPTPERRSRPREAPHKRLLVIATTLSRGALPRLTRQLNSVDGAVKAPSGRT